jgi:hypothetical protein
MIYIIRDDQGTEERFEGDLAGAKEHASEWLRDGDYGEIERTIWIDARIYEAHDAGGGQERELVHVDDVTVSLDPDAPECAEGGEHEWQTPIELVGGIKENPGVIGHGGGVLITSVCPHCGAERVEDTWAQRVDTGEQGLASVAYEAGKHAEHYEARASALGAAGGVDDVDNVLAEQGLDVVRATLARGHLGWDEGARDAGAHRHEGIGRGFVDAYYEAYRDSARVRAEALVAEVDAEAAPDRAPCCDGECGGIRSRCEVWGERDAEDAADARRTKDDAP